MRVLVAILGLFPILAPAQDLGTFQFTSGDISVGNITEIAGNGFTGGVGGGPELLSAPSLANFHGGSPSLNFCFGCGLPGTDGGVGSLSLTKLSNPALAGLVQVFGPQGYLQTGEVTASPIDVTGPGTYSASFTMSDDLAFGPSRTATRMEYADFVGTGTVTLDVAPADCPRGPSGPCGPLKIVSLKYAFAPELDPASLSGAVTLLCGGLLVLRGRRSRVR
jgi:hypothetical protein